LGFIPYRYVGEKRKDTQEKNDNGKITLGFIPYRYVGEKKDTARKNMTIEK
jgi:hypothetical protein